MSTTLDERKGTVEAPYRKMPGDDEQFAHYAPKRELTDAYVFGTPVTALCGKRWIPTRDPQRFPVCPECKEIWEMLA